MAEQNNCLEDKTKDIDSNNSDKTRTAKDIMTKVITQTLYSKPGYHILESYKDRICASLPDDYNNSALRLHTLIGASDHMIQWILTGDMSKANHRIYQVVLVFVCFEPHFIKFCDIMEVLAADNECIIELRKTLIKHLHEDKCITTKEVSQLTSTKLFTAPDIDVVKSATAGTSSIDTTNTTNGTFTFALLDHNEQLGHISMAESLPPVFVEATNARKSSNNTPVTSTSMQYTVQSLKYMNTVNVTENLSDDVLQHVSSEVDHDSMVLIAHTQQSTSTADVKDAGIMKSNDPDIMCTSLNDKIQPLLQTEQLLTSAHAGINGTEINDTEMNTVQENILCTANEEIAASLATIISCTDVSDDSATKLDESSSCKKQMSSLSEQDKHTKIDASEVLEPKTKAVVAEAKLDMYTDASKEVHEILEAKDFAIVREKYNEIITCLPDNYEAMMGSLQDHLSDFQICDILSLTAGHSQKILNCLILQLKSKEDLLDFCDHLEKVQEGAGSLKVIVEQLRKETTEMIQRDSERDTSTAKKPKTAPVVPPVRPPHKYLPFHPALLVIPKTTDPFDLSILADDSKGLAALKKCYSILIENLPSNHLISLVRLQDVAIIPEEVVDSIVPSPSAEIGNKMIINYLIGLIHTEEHIITFCNFTERMLGEFDKCICVLNLKNVILMNNQQVGTASTENEGMCHNVTVTLCEANPGNEPVPNIMSPTEVSKEKDSASLSSKLEINYAGGPTITSIARVINTQASNKPRLDEIGVMRGFLQCMIIDTHGSAYNNTVKAIPLEEPPQDTTDEAISVTSYEQESIKHIKSFIKKDINKELSFSLSDTQNTQKSKQYYLECIEILFKECTRSGAWIYYSGYGEEGTGNWCFMDGTISFQDIFMLYKKYLKEKLLYVFSDCSYSGQWVIDCAKCLDEMGIGACGHQAIKQGILIKVFSSCQPNQKATLGGYVAQKGIYFNETDCSIWLYYGKKLSDSQTTHGLDFTRIKCMQLEGPSAPCRFPDVPAKCSWKWKDIIDLEFEKRPSSLIYTVRGNDRGRKAWHLVLVERELLEDFREKVSTGTIDVAKYGYVIKSGWGTDPPDDIADNLKKYSPNYW